MFKKKKQKQKWLNLGQLEDPDMIYKTSSASTYVSEIQGFMFGGMNSRFWMLRKHFNSMSQSELSKLPFHCWNCISIDLGRREVDIVINCTHKMDVFIKFLIRNIRTVDGRYGTANGLLNIMNIESI